jgi:hypothetical protein
MVSWLKQDIESLKERHYVLKADRDSNYWFGLAKNKIKSLRDGNGPNFNIILKGSNTDETDFYIIPYSQISDLLVDENLYLFNNRERWVGDVNNHTLRIRNSSIIRDVSRFYSNTNFLNIANKITSLDVYDADYSIENARREISVRLNQSKFRKMVLENFNFKCCLTGINETDLLIASHIIPWAKKIESRLDPSNGLCLSIMYDKLFDLGYFSLNNDLEVIITAGFKELSKETQNWLSKIRSKKILSSSNYPISLEAIEYHRRVIFKK